MRILTLKGAASLGRRVLYPQPDEWSRWLSLVVILPCRFALCLDPLRIRLRYHLLDHGFKEPRQFAPVILLLRELFHPLFVGEDDLLHPEGSHRLQAVELGREVSAGDSDDGDMLRDGFAGNERGRDRGAGLHDVEGRLGVQPGGDQTFVLVTPD